MIRAFVIAAAAIGLTACATASAPAPYQAAAGPGATGYLAAPAGNGRTAVTYTGTRNMTRQQVAEYAMLRAAELTLESGNEWFAVINSTTDSVPLAEGEDLSGRSGGFLQGESAGSGSGGGASGNSAPGVRDATVAGGPTTGGFGGGDVPYQVIERWTPPSANRTIMIVQMGTGSQASFEGLDRTPEIFAARAVADEIRAKMAQ